MAVLSRREDDGGFYTRINIGGIATRQVHPDAVRYLTKRGVYVGDEIPPELMRKLRSTKHWLFTKEEFPFVIFPEHKDPSFGTRRSSDKRTAIQGTTRVVASEPIRRRKKSRRSRADRNRAPVPAMPSRSKMNPGWKPDPTQWSEPLPLDPTGEPSIPDVLLSGQPSYPSGGQFETGPQRESGLSGSLIGKRNEPLRLDENLGVLSDAQDSRTFPNVNTGRHSGLRRWYESGGYFPAWLAFLLLIVILVLGYWISAMMDAVF